MQCIVASSKVFASIPLFAEQQTTFIMSAVLLFKAVYAIPDDIIFHEGNVAPGMMTLLAEHASAFNHSLRFADARSFGAFSLPPAAQRARGWEGMLRRLTGYTIGYRHMCRFFAMQWVHALSKYESSAVFDPEVSQQMRARIAERKGLEADAIAAFRASVADTELQAAGLVKMATGDDEENWRRRRYPMMELLRKQLGVITDAEKGKMVGAADIELARESHARLSTQENKRIEREDLILRAGEAALNSAFAQHCTRKRRHRCQRRHGAAEHATCSGLQLHAVRQTAPRHGCWRADAQHRGRGA